jgi:Rieske Fe-S protein
MPNRRDVLKAACGIAVLAAGATIFSEEAFAADGVTRNSNGTVTVDTTKAPGLKKVGGAVVLGSVKGAPTALVRTGANAYQALNLSCTHEGIPVKLQGSDWVCPAHGSAFALNGKVTKGPARQNLATVKAQVKGTQVIVG